MKFYTVYTNPNYNDSIKLIRNGFSWIVFIFGPLGFFYYKNWISGFLLFSGCVLLFLGLHPSYLVALPIHLLAGCIAHLAREWEDSLKGWKAKTLIAANNRPMAILRCLDHYPEWKQKIIL